MALSLAVSGVGRAMLSPLRSSGRNLSANDGVFILHVSDRFSPKSDLLDGWPRPYLKAPSFTFQPISKVGTAVNYVTRHDRKHWVPAFMWLFRNVANARKWNELRCAVEDATQFLLLIYGRSRFLAPFRPPNAIGLNAPPVAPEGPSQSLTDVLWIGSHPIETSRVSVTN